MELLTNDVLLEAYRSAVDQKLDPLFIELLQQEISRRGLPLRELLVS